MDGGPVIETSSGAEVRVWVVPGSSSSEIVGLHGDSVKVRVMSPPEKGRATEEVRVLLEKCLGREVTLIRGMSSRQKVFEVAGLDAGAALRKLGIG